MANEVTFSPGSTNDSYYQVEGQFDDNGTWYVGYWGGGFNGPENGALRFLNVAVTGSVNFAALMIYASTVNPSNNQAVKYKIRGIDQDNTADFSGGETNPFSRTFTDAQVTGEWGDTNSGSWIEINVTSIVNEILARGGWSSGNAMGFIMEDNGTATDQTREVGGAGSVCYLAIRVSENPDFTPDPQTVTAPTLPAAQNWGIKVSEPGVSVFDATEEQLFYTTRKKSMKVVLEGNTDCSAGVLKQVAHGLDYSPTVMGFAKGNTYRFRLSRYYDGAADPVGGGVQGYIDADDTYINIYVTTNANVYYYIFIDTLE